LTMANLGDTPECRRALYELNKTCSADIPERGEFYTFDEYLAERIQTRLYDSSGVVLAASNDDWVGIATTSLREDEGYAFSEMTGVLASHRGRGISMAMKLLAIRFARYTEPSPVRTTFALISAGTGAAALYLALVAVFIALCLLQVRGGWLVDHYHPVSTLLIAASVIPLAFGLMWQYLVQMAVARHAAAYRALAVLHPLWWRLCEATPAIAFTPRPAGRHDERPWPRDVDYCLQCRVREIRDGVLALRPYLGLSDPDRADDALVLLGVSEGDRGLVAEAAWLEVARRAKLAGVQPTSDQVRTAAGAVDLAGEIRSLTRIAKNLLVVDAAADVLDDSRKIRV